MGIVVGHRPLLAPHLWPGCVFGYAIVRDGAGGPAIRIAAQFDRRATGMSADAVRGLWSSIRRQARDPSLAVALSCSVQGEAAVGVSSDTYRALVERLYRGVLRGGATAAMTLALDRDAIARATDVLSPLSVVLTLARQRRAASAIRERVRSPLMPWQPRSTARSAWARAAEAALAEHDGPGSGIVLARPLRTRANVAALWALRRGGSHGVLPGGEAVPPVAFAARPFATGLASGTVTETVWNDGLEPETVDRRYEAIDVDAAFDRVVAILDTLASRRMDPMMTARIDAARQAAARAFAGQLIPAAAEPQASAAATGVATAMEQAIRAHRAGIGSSWARYRFAEPHAGPRLRLGGIVCGVPSLSGEDRVAVDVLHDGGTPALLDFPLSPRPAGDRATLPLQPTWMLTDIACLDDRAAAGSAGRLVPVLPVTKGGIALAPLELPMVSRMHPQPVHLAGQAATATGEPSGGTLVEYLREATRWSFAFAIAHGALDPRDDVWLGLAFDRPSALAAVADAPALTPFAIGLLRFEAGYRSLAPLPDTKGAADAALGSILTGLADALAAPPAAATVPPPVVDAPCLWVWRDRANADGSRSLFLPVDPAAADGPPHFPSVGGCPPLDCGTVSADRAPGPGEWREARYHLPDDVRAAPLAFVLDGLDLLSRQSVAVDARVVRNMGFGLDPRLARATGWATPGPVVTPAIDLSAWPAVSPDGTSFERSLADILEFFRRVGDRIDGGRTLRIDLAYRQRPAMPDGTAAPDVSLPMLSLSPDPDMQPADLAGAIAQRCRAWVEAHPAEAGAGRISLSGTLTLHRAGETVPLLTIRELDLPPP